MCFKTVCNEVQMFAVKNRENVLCRELCLVLHGSLDGKGVWGKMDKCICMKLQYFGHLMRRVDLLEKTLMLGGIGTGREGDDRG